MLQGARSEIFSTQPAPIQVLYLAFLGTTGEMYIDYLIMDEDGSRDFHDIEVTRMYLNWSTSQALSIELVELVCCRPLYNGHTTGIDVIWAGLLMIPPFPEKMATRVAGSLCLATELGDEMIVSSMKGYKEKAVSLVLSCPKLQDLTNRLKATHLSCCLFDIACWVINSNQMPQIYFTE
ncbi:hypothetical protein CQW23_07202 [Capsicum baccatum]|uniref:O-GlcNAc transferase C-terminal domain-containing protein n=1 Tax=Capsicum baccatum TaxID=33114 RepID=A0A2G2X5L2_CAPBA|nr:hypothetical protein CQW23_07202 [Capsicum baccatum]